MTAVTNRELELESVTIEAPHGALLVRIATALARWQAELTRLASALEGLRASGVFLDGEGNPVLPTWWERADRPSSHYLVWPAEYARRAGIPRRQRIDASDFEATEAKRKRTLEYANIKTRYDRLAAKTEDAGQELTRLAEKHGW